MNKTLIVVLFAAVAIVGFVAAGPFITIEGIRSAIESNDSEALSDNVDFPRLRSSLKEQVNALMMAELAAEMEDNPFAALGMVLATKLIDGMVDTFITPSGLARLIAGNQPSKDGTEIASNNTPESELFEDARYTYDSVNKFSAWVKNDQGDKVRIVFTRSDLTWKLSNIVLPQTLLSANSSTDKSVSSEQVASTNKETPPKLIVIEAALKEKTYRKEDYSNGVQEAITMSIVFKNITDRNIRAFDGTLRFTDLLGNPILSANIAINDPVDSGSVLSWSAELDFNQFKDSHRNFRKAKIENINMAFEIEKVLYQDGKTQEF